MACNVTMIDKREISHRMASERTGTEHASRIITHRHQSLIVLSSCQVSNIQYAMYRLNQISPYIITVPYFVYIYNVNIDKNFKK